MKHPLIRDNLTLLEQTRSLAGDINPVHYPEVSGHFRHMLDHYSLFLAHCSAGMVDYDQRDRNTKCETCCETLISVIDEVMAGLDALEVNPIASVKVNCATCTSWDVNAALSTVGRELMFLHTHSTHHLAMISLKLEMAGVDVNPHIGIAPSTERYNLEVSSGLDTAS